MRARLLWGIFCAPTTGRAPGAHNKLKPLPGAYLLGFGPFDLVPTSGAPGLDFETWETQISGTNLSGQGPRNFAVPGTLRGRLRAPGHLAATQPLFPSHSHCNRPIASRRGSAHTR